jgi:hypothetical protein
MAASTTTTVAYIYKRLYSDKQVGDLAARQHPLFSMLRKEDGFNGSGYYYAVRHGNPQAVGGAFSSVQTAGQTAYTGNSYGKQLVALRMPKYGLITLDGEAMSAAEGDSGAFMDLVTQETNGIIEEMGDSLAFDLQRDGSGLRGRRSSLASQTVTLTVKDDARNFKPGMTVVADNAANGLSPCSGSTYVTAVDEDAGTVTFADVSQWSGGADNDYLFRIGDPGTCMEGLKSHFPLSASGLGTTWRGIDRSTDSRRLAGVRLDDSGTSIEECAGLVGVKIGQVGQVGRILVLNPVNFWKVSRRLNAKVTYDGGGNKATYGFAGFDIATPAGDLRAISDADTETTLGYVLNPDTLYLKHLKGLPHIIQDDGRPNLRQASADGLEARMRAWVNMICVRPGANGVFSIA